MTDQDTSENIQEIERISFSEFLESVPPCSPRYITDSLTKARKFQGFVQDYPIRKPEIQLHCPDDACNGTRFFRCTTQNEIIIPSDSHKFIYISYICSNCRNTEKTFSLAVKRDEHSESGICYKFGELPNYGPPTPSKLVKLIGPDREIFLKGRRCENQGLGIGAFVYYRRVVENQKNRILSEIIKVSKKLNVDDGIIQTLESAKTETQFSKALYSVKDALPQTLLINGHNPLTLLHSALSNGLHDQTDEHCLEIAGSVRVILGELAERLSQALKDEAEVNSALSNLLEIKSKG